MKQLIILIAILTLTTMAKAQEADENAIKNEYIVQLNSGVDIHQYIAALPQTEIKQCLSRHMNMWLLRSDEKNILATFKASTDVRSAQYNHTNITHRSLVPNDSLFNLQWNMLNSSTPGADISATQAWQMNHSPLTQMGDSIVVAVIDGGLGFGFDIYHPDINFFVNHHEIPNNGIDDDGNGYIDDYRGWNIFGHNDSVYDNSDAHATHVSGIIGAIGNDSIGVAGVCWGVKILAVNGASNTESDVLMSYDYVMEMRRLYDQTAGAKGAFIVATNSSFGIDFGQPSAHPVWCAMYDSMGALGIISATATANSAWSVDDVGDMPTTCPSKWMIAVTNTTRNDGLNSQAAYGRVNIDLGAPGTSILSCYANDNYGYDAGTSMASPHVAGAIAGLFANACPALLQAYFSHPDSVALLMRGYLLHSVDPLASLHNKTASGGRLNLYHAFIAEEAYNCNNCNYNTSLSQQNLSCYGDHNGSINVSAGSNNAAYHYLWSNGDSTANATNLAAGFYQVTVTDSSGCQRQLSTLIPSPAKIVISSVTIIPLGMDSSHHTIAGNIIVSVTAGSDTLSYAIDNGSYGSSAIFAISSPGLYTIHIRNQTGCVKDTVIGIYYSGIAENGDLSYISFSPNPVSSSGTLSIESEKPFAARLEIHDLAGRIVLSQTLQIANGRQQKQMDLSVLTDGLYIITLYHDDIAQAQMKVSVMH
jgi:hypothetical protein